MVDWTEKEEYSSRVVVIVVRAISIGGISSPNTAHGNTTFVCVCTKYTAVFVVARDHQKML